MKFCFPLFLLFISLFGLTSCESYQVIPLKEAGLVKWKNPPLAYALPKSRIVVEIDFQRTHFKSGPLSAFGNKYLGLSGIAQKDSIAWAIRDVRVSSIAVPDSQQIFLIHSSSGQLPFSLSLKQGIIPLGVNIDQANEKNDPAVIPFQNSQTSTGGGYGFLPTASGKREVVDTTYKTIHTDSTFFKIPVLKKYLVQPTLSDKAEELARQIQEIREEKLGILLGENNKFPEGKAMEVIIAELERIEQEYLRLFCGYSFTDCISQSFVIEPGPGLSAERTALFNFSASRGPLALSEEAGKTVYFILENQRQLQGLQGFQIGLDSLITKTKGLYYRLPEWAGYKLSQEQTTLASGMVSVPQYGAVLFLPARAIRKAKTILLFDSETGSLEGIHR